MFFFPLRTDRPLRGTPWANYALILLNVVVFALQKLSGQFQAGGGPDWLRALNLSSYSLNPGEPHLVHFITYAFLHGSWWHLISNMVFLYIMGNNVSDKLGQIGYVAFYLGGAVMGGVAYVLLSTPMAAGVYAPVVGASGAVAAVSGAFLVLFPRTNVTCVYFLFVLIGAFEIPALMLVPMFFATDVVMSLMGSSEVAHTAHIGGTLFGVGVSLAMAGAKLLPRDQWDLWALLQRWNRRRQYRTMVASGWNPYASFPPAMQSAGGGSRGSRGEVEELEDPRQRQVAELRAQVSEAMAHRNLSGAADLYLQLRAMDPNQVLSRNAQLDIANQLAELSRYTEAAEAYELFLKHYPAAEQHAHVELLTGLLYSRYLDDPARARAKLEHALPRLSSTKEIELAQSELTRLSTGVQL